MRTPRFLTPSQAALLCVALLGAGHAAAAPAQTQSGPPPRFALKASLQAAPQPLLDHRFELKGRLELRAASRPVQTARLSLTSSLAPKNGPRCLGPGSVFYDGFEAGP